MKGKGKIGRDQIPSVDDAYSAMAQLAKDVYLFNLIRPELLEKATRGQLNEFEIRLIRLTDSLVNLRDSVAKFHDRGELPIEDQFWIHNAFQKVSDIYTRRNNGATSQECLKLLSHSLPCFSKEQIETLNISKEKIRRPAEGSVGNSFSGPVGAAKVMIGRLYNISGKTVSRIIDDFPSKHEMIASSAPEQFSNALIYKESMKLFSQHLLNKCNGTNRNGKAVFRQSKGLLSTPLQETGL